MLQVHPPASSLAASEPPDGAPGKDTRQCTAPVDASAPESPAGGSPALSDGGGASGEPLLGASGCAHVPLAVDEAALHSLTVLYARNSFRTEGKRTGSDRLRRVQQTVALLLARDYEFATIGNANGELCASYPAQILVPHTDGQLAADELRAQFEDARFARAHGRFIVPALLVGQRYVCRSGTLSNSAETILNNVHAKTKQFIYTMYGDSTSFAPKQSFSIQSQRAADMRLLQTLGVRTICDLMVENRKKKYGVHVCSSEKVEDFADDSVAVVAIPFPGCEFFADFKANDRCGTGLRFEWGLNPENDAVLSIGAETAALIGADFSGYRSWDLVTLTRNYLHLMLTYLADEDEPQAGLLVHCISGWDRTPMFISLLRILLWAEGEVHQNLSAVELLYFTIAYDWFLFSHWLGDRAMKGEDIFYFSFYMLQFLTDDDDSLRHWRTVVAARRQERSSTVRSFVAGVLTRVVAKHERRKDLSNAEHMLDVREASAAEPAVVVGGFDCAAPPAKRDAPPAVAIPSAQAPPAAAADLQRSASTPRSLLSEVISSSAESSPPTPAMHPVSPATTCADPVAVLGSPESYDDLAAEASRLSLASSYGEGGSWTVVPGAAMEAARSARAADAAADDDREWLARRRARLDSVRSLFFAQYADVEEHLDQSVREHKSSGVVSWLTKSFLG